MGHFGESAKGFLQGHELLAEEIEEQGNVHVVHFLGEAVEALAKVALTGERQMVLGVVTAELLAAQGDGTAAPSGVGQDEGALAGWPGAAA